MDFTEYLKASVGESIEKGVFAPAVFFKKWFREYGETYYCLFKKNLKVTDIQFAELLSLIQLNISENTDTDTGIGVRFQFLSSREFNLAINDGYDTIKSYSDRADLQDVLVELCGAVLMRTIVVDPFFGSCAIFIPPHLEIDIRSICTTSGYIHSCGRNVFIRKILKSEKVQFFHSIKEHLESSREDGVKTSFRVYAHEDFSLKEAGDNVVSSMQKNGLNDVKVYVEKFHMGGERLVNVLKDMKDFSEKNALNLIVSDPSTYSESFRSKPEAAGSTKTLLLVVDHTIDPITTRAPALDRYYICFEEEFLNNNPYHIFDENKPAWVSHTTIPHTLMGAMINLTRCHWPKDRAVEIIDPFVGAGTTFIEVLKFENVTISCSDKLKLSPTLVADNIIFFSLSLETLKEIRGEIQQVIENLRTPLVPKHHEKVNPRYKWVCDFMSQYPVESESYAPEQEEEIVKALEGKKLRDRLFYYIALRTEKRHSVAILTEREDWLSAFSAESNELCQQISALIKMKEEIKADIIADDSSILAYKKGFSTACTLCCAVNKSSKQIKADLEAVKVMNIEDLSKECCDVIITDPPYGFNTKEDTTEFLKLYAILFEKMLSALRPDGQLLFCLPDRSYTGQQIPFFVTKEFVFQLLLATADKLGRELYTATRSFPTPRNIYRPPFYWESEKALKRAILHFFVK